MTTLTKDEGVQLVCLASLDVRCENLAPHKRLGEKDECSKGNAEKIAGYNM